MGAQEEAASPATVERIFDRRRIEAIVDGDLESVGVLAEAFASSAVETIGELRAARDRGDLMELGRLAHRFKSAAGQIGADPSQQLCVALEQLVQNPVTAATASQGTAVATQLIESMDALVLALQQLARAVATPS